MSRTLGEMGGGVAQDLGRYDSDQVGRTLEQMGGVVSQAPGRDDSDRGARTMEQRAGSLLRLLGEITAIVASPLGEKGGG
jgi:hypothetical protein